MSKVKDEIISGLNEVQASKATRQKNASPSTFPIVGIGASAGGLEALEQFFGNMPKDSGMAFVVIQHLDPNHAGIMPELLQRVTQMKVLQATDKLKVKPGFVYVIPPNRSLSILSDTLYLFAPVESRGLRLPIDVFFRSLANDREERSIGIILSGMGSDGSLGVKAIKEKNGLVLVQDPATAKFDGMPRSSLEAVIADIVAPANELPAKLLTFLKYIPILNPDIQVDDQFKSNLAKIVLLLREKTGHDFSLYKKNTLFRRIDRRKGAHQIEKISGYVRYLQENPEEIEILYKELLIGVTSFFRDPDIWKKLKEEVLPGLINASEDGVVLRAWVAACSTGEESYSLAIVFWEALEKFKHKHITLQIFATDLDTTAIELARKGAYSKNIAADVSPERMGRFFVPEGEGFRLNASIREMVIFAPHNVIKDPPFTKLDLLTCRNLLIYMEPELQKKMISLFNYSLKPGGIMILGSAENVGDLTDGFEELYSKFKIFRRSSASILPVQNDFPSSFHRVRAVAHEGKNPRSVVESVQTLTDQLLLQRFTPASVLVNDRGDIIYITGRTGKYLEPVAGEAFWNINAMAREGLREVLPQAFRKAMQNFDPIIIRNNKIGTNGGTQIVDLTVQRIESDNSLKGMILVVFTDVILETKPIDPAKGKRRSSLKQKELENDLQHSFEDLQSLREEMQTSQEELKSTNEELQSTNEELQSTNEELTTSKEEMQSLNEEMQTVNAELQCKISDFQQANNDMKNLLNSTEIATLFLDKELNIRRFTESAVQIIKLRNSDVGRPFTDLVTDLQYPEIENHAKRVLKTLMTIETTITTNHGKWYLIRIMPYRTSDDYIDGLVITFSDITVAEKMKMELKIINDALAVSETRYRRLFESTKDGILILNAETGKIVDVNPCLIKLLGYSKNEFTEKAIWEIGFLKDLVSNKEKFLELQKDEVIRYENLPLETFEGKKINVEFISNIYLENDQKVIQCNIRESNIKIT
jgi:two-component system CheB/CheR fusion protein